MAIRKASASNIEGARFNDASAGTTQIPDVPDKVTLGTPIAGQTGVAGGPGTITIPFTVAPTGGIPTNFVATSDPDSLTGSSTGSPIVVSGVVGGTTYTFTVVASNTTGASPASDPSTPVTAISEYSLSSTFTSSGTFTVPAGKTRVAAFLVGGGGSGGSGGTLALNSFNSSSGGGGGGAGAAVGFQEYEVNSGTSYTITIGGAGGGATSFGNLITANGGSNAPGGNNENAGSGGNVTSNIPNYINASQTGGSRSGGKGGNAYPFACGAGTAGGGGGGSTITMNLTGLGSVDSGFTASGGGGGGGGATAGYPGCVATGASGGSANGGSGAGGAGGNAIMQSTTNNGGGGASASTNAFGGGGGGGGGAAGGTGKNRNSGGGGNSKSGKVIVYVK